MTLDPFGQHHHRVRLEWGPDGAATLGPACSTLVIVDVLSFSTAVDIAIGRGASILPLRRPPLPSAPVTGGTPSVHGAEAGTPTRGTGTLPAGVVPAGVVPAVRRGSGGWSLSPSSLLSIPAGTRLALPSPNGATLSAAAAGYGAVVLAGCLRNASAVAAGAALAAAGGAIGVVAAGERWPGGGLRPAVEDLLGAGAAVAGLVRLGVGPCSPEALAAADAFEAARRRGLAGVLAACSSGRELADAGFAADVALAAEHDVSRAVPELRGGEYRLRSEAPGGGGER